MRPCHLEPGDKRAFIDSVGRELVEKHGKQKFYKTADVRSAAERLGYSVDVHCWAYCIFSSPQDFKAIHDAAGEVCDYAAMKASVLSELALNGSFSLLDIDLSWLEWPDIDLASLFGWFDF